MKSLTKILDIFVPADQSFISDPFKPMSIRHVIIHSKSQRYVYLKIFYDIEKYSKRRKKQTLKLNLLLIYFYEK